MKQRLLAIILGILLCWPLFALAGYMDHPRMDIPPVVGEYLKDKADEYGRLATTLIRMCPPVADKCFVRVYFRDPKVPGGVSTEGSVGHATFEVDSHGTLGRMLIFEWPNGKRWQRGQGIQKLPDDLT